MVLSNILTYKVTMSYLTRSLPVIISALVMIIAGSSFVLSYVNLRDIAIQAGIPEHLAFMWPLCLDAFLILSSIYILKADTSGESTLIGWIILITFTSISVIFNMQGSTTIISMAIHAIPPISLCVSLELLMQMIRSIDNDVPAVIISDHPETNGDRIKQYLINNPGKTIRDAASDLSCSPATVSKYKRQLHFITIGDQHHDNEKRCAQHDL